MIDEICAYLNNWFDRDMPKYFGTFKIENGQIVFPEGDMEIQRGQFFRVIGSVFNDGAWMYGIDQLNDETFTGAVWLMAVPQAVVLLAAEVEAWQQKYGGVNSENMSPFSSESFGGYSYQKAQGSQSDASGGSVGVSWQSVFAARLRRWKKL